MEFYQDLDRFDDSKIHQLSEYNDTYSPDYVKNIPNRYWVYMGGRAVLTYKKILPLRNFDIIVKDSKPCSELIANTHFHVDLYKRYVPGLCSGFGIDIEDLGDKLDIQKYPLITTLFEKGIEGLFGLAEGENNFSPQKRYLSKCDLCLDIRFHLFKKFPGKFNELSPSYFYANIY